MANGTEDWKDLSDQLAVIHDKWTSVGMAYDDPEPRAGDEHDWAGLFRTDSPLTSHPGYMSFAGAFSCSAISLWQLFRNDFAEWAARMVGTFGIERFPHRCGDPPVLEPWKVKLRRQSLTQMLTNSDESIEAGMRVTLWGAACAIPSDCHRSPDYRLIVYPWISNLIDFGAGRCWASTEVFDWIWQAAGDLAVGQPDETENCWSAPRTPTEWAKYLGLSWDTLKKLFDRQQIRNRRLSSKSYRVHKNDLPVDR